MVVAPDGKVYQYTFSWKGSLHEEGAFTEWKDLTGSWESLATDSHGTLNSYMVARAMEVLEAEQ